jgi:restriction system protein
MTYTSYKSNKEPLIPAHGGYKKLESYKTALIIFDGTDFFCRKYKSYLTYKTYEQMIGAARSGKQNIVEGSIDSGTSKKTELKLTQIARGSFGELLEDYQDFLRGKRLSLWAKDDPRIKKIRSLTYTTNKSYSTYKTYIESPNPEVSANTLLCLIHQTNYLLDQQLRSLEKAFVEEGGFTERMYRIRNGQR